MRPAFTGAVLISTLAGCGDAGDPAATSAGAGASATASSGAGAGANGAGGAATSSGTGGSGAGPTFRDRCEPSAAPEPPPPLRTFYVDADAGDDSSDGLTKDTAWKTLTKANAAAQAGDLFLVRGTFVGQYIRPNTGGTATDMIVYRVMSGESSSIQEAEYGTAVWLTGVEYVVADGFDITQNDDPASLGNGDWLRNCHIHDNSGYVRILGADDTRVEDNDIPTCGTYCFWVSEGSTKNQILRNSIGTSTSVSFWLASPGNTIGYNDFANTLEENLALNGGADQTTIECNSFRLAGTQAADGYYTPSVRIGSNQNVIRYNLVYGNALEGISFWVNANDNAMYHNVVWGNGGPDLRLLVDLDTGTIQNNTFRNNVFWNNNSSDDSHWNYQGTKGKVVVDTYHVGTDGWTDGSFGGNALENNVVGADASEIGKGWLLMIGYTKVAVFTLDEAATQWPASIVANLEADPQLADPASGDFHLGDGSPCIDKGVPIEGLDFDGAAPDLGRFEQLEASP